MGDGAASSTQASDELRYFAEDEPTAFGLGLGALMAVPAYAFVQFFSDSHITGMLAGVSLVARPAFRLWRAKTRPRATLRVHEGALQLTGRAFVEPRSVQLEDLLDVYLEAETNPRPRRRSEDVRDLALPNHTVVTDHDGSRIALELRTETLYLTGWQVAHLDASDWFSKIRRFLRQHGWVPADERPESDSSNFWS